MNMTFDEKLNFLAVMTVLLGLVVFVVKAVKEDTPAFERPAHLWWVFGAGTCYLVLIYLLCNLY